MGGDAAGQAVDDRDFVPGQESSEDDDLVPEDDVEDEYVDEEEDEFYDDDDVVEQAGRGAGANKNKNRTKKSTGNANKKRKTGVTRKGSVNTKGGGGRGAAKRKPRLDLEEDVDLEDAFDSDADPEASAYVLGAEDESFHDFSQLELKEDHPNRPLWVCPDGRVFLETFSPVYKQAYDFLISIAEPVSRPECIHEYVLTPHSLYASVSIGLDTSTIISVLDRLSKNHMPSDIRWFIRESTENYGKVKLVLKNNRFLVESPDASVLRKLLADEVIREARMGGDASSGTLDGDGFLKSKALKDRAVDTLAATKDIELKDVDNIEEVLDEEDEDEEVGGFMAPASHVLQEDPDQDIHSFEVKPNRVEHVKSRCLPGGLNYPMLEEYDFKGDTQNPTLAIDLKPHVKHRSYQEKSLSKMFGNSRARSGIIVLPCGAGKSLVGVSAAARIKKSCLCLCTNSVSVDQWKYQFQLWTTLRDDQICRFTSAQHEWFKESSDGKQQAGVCITTYTMVAYSGKRSAGSERIMDEIMSREWGLILLDEVHVVPAQMFRKVLGIVKAHCKLGLTATLVREDQLITDLNFLIGPKLYEANWLDLTKNGHIANVQCAEVWCPMTPEFLREYLKPETTASQKQLLFVMNPNKARACDYLVRYHETRGDKIIVFSDNLFALREYAVRMKKPFLYGGTGHQERTRILHAFKTNPAVNTIFLSKVGDNSLDIPEANVLIQISSHAGSRRQEAQRLGRILRKKKQNKGSLFEEFDAFFYTLVSNDTREVFFTSKRQQFLIDQGYSYKVISKLLGAEDDTEELLLGNLDDQITLLASVLHASEEVEVQEETDGLAAGGKGASSTRKVGGSIAALSGAKGLKYMEYSSAHGKTGSGRSKSLHSSKEKKLAKLRKLI
jgi:DNA excision repair protein ERCC-3